MKFSFSNISHIAMGALVLASSVVHENHAAHFLSDNQKTFCKFATITAGISAGAWLLYSYFRKPSRGNNSNHSTSPEDRQLRRRSAQSWQSPESSDTEEWKWYRDSLRNHISQLSSPSANSSSNSRVQVKKTNLRKKVIALQEVVPATNDQVQQFIETEGSLRFIPRALIKMFCDYYGSGKEVFKPLNSQKVRDFRGLLSSDGRSIALIGGSSYIIYGGIGKPRDSFSNYTIPKNLPQFCHITPIFSNIDVSSQGDFMISTVSGEAGFTHLLLWELKTYKCFPLELPHNSVEGMKSRPGPVFSPDGLNIAVPLNYCIRTYAIDKGSKGENNFIMKSEFKDDVMVDISRIKLSRGGHFVASHKKGSNKLKVVSTSDPSIQYNFIECHGAFSFSCDEQLFANIYLNEMVITDCEAGVQTKYILPGYVFEKLNGAFGGVAIRFSGDNKYVYITCQYAQYCCDLKNGTFSIVPIIEKRGYDAISMPVVCDDPNAFVLRCTKGLVYLEKRDIEEQFKPEPVKNLAQS